MVFLASEVLEANDCVPVRTLPRFDVFVDEFILFGKVLVRLDDETALLRTNVKNRPLCPRILQKYDSVPRVNAQRIVSESYHGSGYPVRTVRHQMKPDVSFAKDG